MQSQDSYTQVTFHYDNGQADTFALSISPQEFQQQINLLLERPWLTFHLFDQTVVIATNKITKVEVKPALQNRGVGIFPDSQRVTALTRGAR